MCGVLFLSVSFVSCTVMMSAFVFCASSVSSSCLLLIPFMLICMIVSSVSLVVVVIGVCVCVGFLFRVVCLMSLLEGGLLCCCVSVVSGLPLVLLALT
jgi:hypothetical protein